MNKALLLKAATAASFLCAGIAFAADGDLSSTDSTATSEVKAVIPELIKITGLTDLDMGTYDPAAPGDMTANSIFCVYRNSTVGEYTLKLEGDGGLDATTDFEIDNGMQTQSGGKHTIQLKVKAIYRDANEMILGEAFKGQTTAEAAVRMLKKELGLRARSQPDVARDDVPSYTSPIGSASE